MGKLGFVQVRGLGGRVNLPPFSPSPIGQLWIPQAPGQPDPLLPPAALCPPLAYL